MKTTLNILIAEHDKHDLAMIDNELKKGGIDFVSEIVQNEAGYRKALKNFIPDIILCDYRFPSFDGPTAFKIREQLAPETPFIIVSGTIGEENSIELIKNGVTDFVLKDKMFALNIKVKRALYEAKEKKEKSRTEIELKQTATHLTEAQKLAKLGSWDYDLADNKLTWSEQLYSVFDTDKQTFTETHGSFLQLIDEADREYAQKTSKHTQDTGDAFIIEYGITTHKGEKRVIQEHGYGVKDATGKVIRLFGTAQDITERKKAENAVKESEARYRAFFENSMDGILLTVTDGNILAANPAACKIFNMTEQEICDAGRFGLVDLTDPRVENLIKERQLTGKAQGELTFLRKDGTTFAGEISSVLFTDSFGQERTSMIIRDISERKEAEEKLKDNYTLLRITGEIAKIGGWYVKLEENRVYWSDEVATLHEMPPGYAPLVEDAFEFYVPEWRDKIREVFTNCAQKGISYDEDMEIITSSGKRIWVRTNGEAVRDQNGKIVKVHGTFQDITEKKRLEKAFEVERQQFFDLISEAPSSMGVLSGPDHRFKMANPLYLQLIGKTDIIGKLVKDVLPEIAEQGFIDILDSVYQTGKTYSANEMLIKLDVENNGNPVDRYLNFIYQPHIGTNEKTNGILFFAVDVSEQVLSRKKIEESEAKLKEAQTIAQIGSWELDFESNTLTLSDEGSRLFGLPADQHELLSEDWMNLVHPDDREGILNKIEKSRESLSATSYDHRIVLNNGTIKYIHSESKFRFDSEGNSNGMNGTMQDVTVRKQTEEKLELTQFTFDHASDAIFWMTSDARIVDVNESACHSLGYTRQELLRLSVPDIDPYFNVETWSGFFPELRKKLTIPIETKHLRKDGSLIPVEIRANYIKFGNRELSCAFVRDISERKLTEAALIESEQEVRAIAESMPQIVWVTTAEGKNIYLNQQWVDYTGLSLVESYDDGWLIPFHEDDKPIAWEAWNNAVANQAEYSIECRIKRYDGTYHWWLVRGVPKMNEKGEIFKWYGTCTNIEKIKQAENQIRKSEVFNRSVVNSLSAHLAVVNEKGDIVSINEAWSNFALQNGETSMERTGVGSNYFEVCEKAFIDGEEIAGRVLQGMKNVLNKKIEDFYLEYPCHSPSEQRWFGLRIAKFEGDEPLILLAHTNLTDRILAEGERQKITDDLIHRNRDLEQFTYIVSHNLRAPVANIKGLSDILGDESLSIAETGSVVNDLLSSVTKLDSVILDLNDILQLKIDVNKAKEPVVFEELVKGVKESILSLVLREKVTIKTRFDKVPEMFTLKSYLYSIFYNLISNSIKYKRPDAQLLIEIKSSRKEDAIELVFKDNGKGIDLNKSRAHVFGLYKRFHRDIEGKGMGLFMVKTQVEALGGTISIESEVNKGTTFKIIFRNQKNHDN